MKIKATTPCYKFINASPEQQLAKIREEVEEVAQAWTAYSADKTAENLQQLLVELLDVKACVNTAMAQIHKDNDTENTKRGTMNLAEAQKQMMAPATERKFFPLLDFRYHKSRAKSKVIDKNLRRGYYIEGKGEAENE